MLNFRLSLLQLILIIFMQVDSTPEVHSHATQRLRTTDFETKVTKKNLFACRFSPNIFKNDVFQL